jgi:hypothetical protein
LTGRGIPARLPVEAETVETVVFMKSSMVHRRLLVAVGAVLCLPVAAAWAAETNAPSGATSLQPTVAAGAPTVASTAPAKLPYGVDDVLKLSRAQVSEDIVLNYIQNSGTIYNLGPNEIVYLRNQGVSDHIVNAMLDQRKRVIEAAGSAASPAPVQTAATGEGIIAPSYPPPAPIYIESPAPEEPAPASSVYVIPSPAVRAAYYSSYTYGSPYLYYGPYTCYGSYGGYWPGYYYGGYSRGYYHGYGR